MSLTCGMPPVLLTGVLRRHGISSLNNLIVLAAAVAYGWTLAGRLALGL
jgi:hypothetical protein